MDSCVPDRISPGRRRSESSVTVGCDRDTSLSDPSLNSFASGIQQDDKGTDLTTDITDGQVDVALLESAFTEHLPSLRERVFMIVGSTEEAEDVIQEVFAATLREVQKGKTIKNLGAWLNICSRNAAITILRERRQKPQVTLVEEADSTTRQSVHEALQSTEEAVESLEKTEAVMRVLSSMPERQCMAFLLSEVRGLSYSQAASELDTTAPAVRQLLFRARSELRRSLGTKLATAAAPVLSSHFNVNLEDRVGALTRLNSWFADRIFGLYVKVHGGGRAPKETLAAALAPVAAGAMLVIGGVGGLMAVGALATDRVGSILGSSEPASVESAKDLSGSNGASSQAQQASDAGGPTSLAPEGAASPEQTELVGSSETAEVALKGNSADKSATALAAALDPTGSGANPFATGPTNQGSIVFFCDCSLVFGWPNSTSLYRSDLRRQLEQRINEAREKRSDRVERRQERRHQLLILNPVVDPVLLENQNITRNRRRAQRNARRDTPRHQDNANTGGKSGSSKVGDEDSGSGGSGSSGSDSGNSSGSDSSGSPGSDSSGSPGSDSSGSPGSDSSGSDSGGASGSDSSTGSGDSGSSKRPAISVRPR